MGNIGKERRRIEVLPVREPAPAPAPANPPEPARREPAEAPPSREAEPAR